MMPSSMLQPSPISTTLAFSSRVCADCSVALILSISALVMTVAVVGFPGLGWAMSATGITTAAASRTFSVVFFIVLLLNISSSLRRRQQASHGPDPDGHGVYRGVNTIALMPAQSASPNGPRLALSRDSRGHSRDQASTTDCVRCG